MPRGFVWGAYLDDRGQVWALRVDADLALQAQRGWLGGDPDGQAPMPRGWQPRRVVGIEPNGRLHKAVVATLDAQLWTQPSATFDIESSGGGIVTCTVIRKLAERSIFGSLETAAADQVAQDFADELAWGYVPC